MRIVACGVVSEGRSQQSPTGELRIGHAGRSIDDPMHAMPTFPVRRCLLVSARVVNHGRLTSPTSVRECAKLPALLKALLKDLIRLDPFKPCKVSTILYRALPNILGDYAYHRHQ